MIVSGILTLAAVVACSAGRLPAPAGAREAAPTDAHSAWTLTVRLAGFPAIRVFGVSGAGPLDTADLVVVMHGTERNASEYRDAWIPLVKGRSMIVVVPEFREADFPGAEEYNLGGIVDDDGDAVPREHWTFSVIEPIVAIVRDRTSNTGTTFAMFGHSAGAQFVHRYLELMPGAPVSTAVAANAGWYTMPDRSAPFPYGLAELPAGPVDLRRLFARDLVVLLGSRDVETENLRRDDGANAQGATRYQRGLNFFARGRAAAADHGLDFRWRLVVVPGVDHDHVAMGAAAVELLESP